MDRSQNTDDKRRDVQSRAYQRYEARGREDGHDQEDWYAAEQEMRDAGADASDKPFGAAQGEAHQRRDDRT